MRLIDADILYPDSVSIKGDRLCISQSQIANAPTVDVLDKIRAEIERASHGKWYVGRIDGKSEEVLLLDEVLQIIDKYKEE